MSNHRNASPDNLKGGRGEQVLFYASLAVAVVALVIALLFI